MLWESIQNKLNDRNELISPIVVNEEITSKGLFEIAKNLGNPIQLFVLKGGERIVRTANTRNLEELLDDENLKAILLVYPLETSPYIPKLGINSKVPLCFINQTGVYQFKVPDNKEGEIFYNLAGEYVGYPRGSSIEAIRLELDNQNSTLYKDFMNVLLLKNGFLQIIANIMEENSIDTISGIGLSKLQINPKQIMNHLEEATNNYLEKTYLSELETKLGALDANGLTALWDFIFEKMSDPTWQKENAGAFINRLSIDQFNLWFNPIMRQEG